MFLPFNGHLTYVTAGPTLSFNATQPGAHLNIKMSSYQYKDSHYKDKMVSWPSYLYNGNCHTWKDGLYIERQPWICLTLRCRCRKQSSWGQYGAHLGPVGPRWAPCWPHEPYYQGNSRETGSSACQIINPTLCVRTTTCLQCGWWYLEQIW